MNKNMEQKEAKKKYQAVYPTVWNYLQRMDKTALVMYLTGMLRLKEQRYDGRQYIAVFRLRRWNPLYVAMIIIISVCNCVMTIMSGIMDSDDIKRSISCPILIRETDSDVKIVREDLNHYINNYNNK